jgi:RHS repeat-associated protein
MPAENPEGNVGALRSQVVTGGSYDIHSGNASRIVNDLHVPGALGTYGLDFTRYWNSLHDEDTNSGAVWPTDFGYSGWSHSWKWNAVFDWEWPDPEGGGQPNSFITSITVTFPDGHATKFKLFRSSGYPWGEARVGPPYYAAHHEDAWPCPGEAVHDNLAEMAEDGHEFWIYRADGGSVRFAGYDPEYSGGYARWKYRATEVYDLHGLRTTLIYEGGLLTYVKDEGNRWLKISWMTFTGYDGAPVIGKVETGGDAGSQAVNYKYSKDIIPINGYVLAKVTYAGTPAPGQTASAIYMYGHSYQGDQPNVGPQTIFPILKRADDPHYAGAMTKIFYNYYGSECRPPNFAPPHPSPSYYDQFYFKPEAIAEELSDGAAGAVVSRFTAACHTGTRADYNGLGGVRTFYFGSTANESEIHGRLGYQLTKVTDFAFPANPPGLPSRKQDGPEPSKVWDGRGTKTRLDYDDSGQPSGIHYFEGSNCSYDRMDVGNASGSLAPDLSRMHNRQHHWLFKKTDENGNVTVYRRDERRRVTNISYYDAGNNLLATEGYTYNQWNQVETHTLPSSGGQPAVQRYLYNGLHQLEREDNSVDLAISPSDFKFYTYYGPGNHPEWADLVEMVIDGRARVNGTFTVKMTYNGRQQVMSEEYPGTGGSAHPTVRYEYDNYGNCTAIINEIGQRKDYTYDSYRRCTSLTEWVLSSGGGCPSLISRRWDWIYDRVIDFGPPTGVWGTPYPASAHTSKEWRIQIEPAFNEVGHRRGTSRTFDVNNRMLSEQTGLIQLPGTALGHFEPPGAYAETHSVTYDANGQKSSSTDSRGRVTTYGYDLRNRLETTTEPKRQDQPAYPVTRLEYDRAGNKTKVTFPDQKTQQWLYHDAFGQPRQFIDERGNPTDLNYWPWGPMKKLSEVITHGGGAANQSTRFYYDLMGRPQTTSFPDTTTEVNTYEFGQLKTWKTRKDQVKTLSYDARGREISNSWSTAPSDHPPPLAPGITRIWDDANRLSQIANAFSTIDYSYDGAGQVRTEGTTVIGSGALKEVRYCRYPSGEVSDVTYPNGSVIHRNYTARGQLEGVGWGVGSTSYAYWPDGTVNYQARSNGVTTSYGYDGRGMISSVQHRNDAAGHDLARRDYWRDDRDRIRAWKRGIDHTLNQMENGRGNRYGYDDEGQLTSASYRAENPEGTPTGAVRTDSFQYDPLGNRMGMNHVASRGAWMNFTRRDNGLNQYHSWENDHPAPDPLHWGSGIFHDDNIFFPSPPWVAPGNGVTMADGWIVASYNALNQPMAVGNIGYGSNYMFFGYDPLGRCVKRWKGPPAAGTSGYNPATYFYYDGWSVVQEGSSTAAADRLYVHGGRVDEMVASQVNGVWYHHHYDAQGNCIMQTTGGGGLQVQYDYDAFGFPYFYNADGGKGAAQTRFLFTGREWLADHRLYDFRARMYQPELGRFLQPDPKQFAAGDYNLYRYCHSDPVNKTDPTGLVVNADDETKKMMDGLRNENDNLRSAIDQLRGSDKVHDFKPAEDARNPAARGPNGLKGNHSEPRRSIGDWLKHLFRPYNKSGSTTYFNPRNNQDVKGAFRDARAQLAHEIGHALDYDNGTANSALTGDRSVPAFEARGIWWENEANRSLGLDQRGWNDWGR